MTPRRFVLIQTQVQMSKLKLRFANQFSTAKIGLVVLRMIEMRLRDGNYGDGRAYLHFKLDRCHFYVHTVVCMSMTN